jgi:polyisoprenoid-binding protein YceI
VCATQQNQMDRTAVLLALALGWAILGASVPSTAAERYVIALQQSQFQFQAYSLFVKPQGTFHIFSGEIVADAHNMRASRVRFVIDATSLDTGNAKRDKHLRSETFLFVDKYPTITFMSSAITRDGENYRVQGDLQIRGVTKRITIPVTVEQQQERIVVRGSTRLKRRDFGVNYNAFFNPVQNEVDVRFTIVGVKP